MNRSNVGMKNFFSILYEKKKGDFKDRFFCLGETEEPIALNRRPAWGWTMGTNCWKGIG